MAESALRFERASQNLWLRRISPSPHASVHLVCFPYAGAGASSYYPWVRILPSQIGLYAVQLPGREDRISERPVREVPIIINALIDALSDLAGVPFVFFGHSMGALLAFEVARELRNRALKQPAHLFVSGRQAPSTPFSGNPLYMLPDGAFLEECVRRYQGIPQAILNEPELMSLLLPVLRADMEMIENYRHKPQAPLHIPITALYGREDRTLKILDVQAWAQETSDRFSYAELPGGHFFLQTARSQVVEIIDRIISTTYS